MIKNTPRSHRTGPCPMQFKSTPKIGLPVPFSIFYSWEWMDDMEVLETLPKGGDTWPMTWQVKVTGISRFISDAASLYHWESLLLRCPECFVHACHMLFHPYFFYTSDSQAGLTSLRQESHPSDLCLGPQQNVCHKPLYHPVLNFSVL